MAMAVIQLALFPAVESPDPIRAITVYRQWAERIADGRKIAEVRRSRTAYRGPLIVTISGEKIAYCMVDLVDVVEASTIPSLTPEELAYGKYAYVLRNPL